MKRAWVWIVLLCLSAGGLACKAFAPGSTSFSNLSADLPIGGPATFNFRFTGRAASYRVNLSTTADLSWDVYLSFAEGPASPLQSAQPAAQWAKYTCGRILYWQVVAAGGQTSPVQKAIVTCPQGVPPSPPAGTYTGLFASLPSNGPAQFYFQFSDQAESFRVDISTLADMSWDVYLSFAEGTESPLSTANPARWAKYACGRALYWRVVSAGGVESPIQSAKVSCE